MNLRDLQYLVALAEERHFGRAAERCFVSQPSLSGQIKKLEERLGVTLVERDSRRVVMTDVGQAVTDQAQRVLAEAKVIGQIAASYRDPLAGDLHMGIIPTVGPYLLPLFMPRVRRDYPRLKLFLHEHQTAVLLQKLRDGQLDLLILALPVGSGEFSEIELYTEPFRLAVPLGDPLTHERRLTIDNLSGRDVLLLEEGHCLRGQALDICMTAGAKEYAGFRGTSLETLRHMVAEGIGSTLMPELATPKQTGPHMPVSYLPFSEPGPSRRIGILHRRGSSRTPLFESLGKLIRQSSGLGDFSDQGLSRAGRKSNPR